MGLTLIFFIEVFLFAFSDSNLSAPLGEIVGLLFVCINVVIVSLKVFQAGRSFLWIFLFALFLREFLLFSDVYQWFPVPHSGADSEAFHFNAVRNATFFQFSEGGGAANYINLISAIYYIVGPIRIVAQQLNVVIGMEILFVALRIFDELSFSLKQKKLSLILLAFFPHLAIFSSVLLREAPIQLALTYSMLFFIFWMKNGKMRDMVVAVGFTALAAFFHGGCVFWTLGYIAALSLYRPSRRKNTLSFATIGGLVFAGIAALSLVPFMDSRVDAMATALGEGGTVVDGEENSDAAGSAYLTWLTISNPYLLLLFSPLKMFYFIFSPLPPDWRGGMDLIAFFFDSSFYLWAFWRIFRGMKCISSQFQKNVVRYLMIGVLAMTFAFGYGTIASGTALRHRCKFFPELLVCAVLCVGTKRSRKIYEPRQPFKISPRNTQTTQK